MKTIPTSALTMTPEQLAQRVAAYTAALKDHKNTVGVPAPLEDRLVMEIVKKHGGQFVVQETDEPVRADELQVRAEYSKRGITTFKMVQALIEAFAESDPTKLQTILDAKNEIEQSRQR